MSPLLGLDYGLRRIGVAVSDATNTLATALHTHDEVEGSFFTYLAQVIREREIEGIVLGLPLKTSGDEGAMADRIRDFARQITARTGLPVYLEDERYSSQEAEGYLRLSHKKRRPKSEVDALAAALILQQYLDRRSRTDSRDDDECAE
jgi:putative Holliday junction resolvase